MYRIEYLPVAVQDLTDITRYIGITQRDPFTANRLTEKIMSAIENLREMPYKYQSFRLSKPLSNDYRRFRVNNYIVFYTVDESKKLVTIYRVLYQKRDYEKLL